MRAVIKPGDHIASPRHLVEHHAIVILNGTIVEYRRDHDGRMRVCRGSLQEFIASGGGKFRVVRYTRPVLPARETIVRAVGLLGREQYNIAGSNCEHLAAWCKTCRWQSHQAVAGLSLAFGGLFLASA